MVIDEAHIGKRFEGKWHTTIRMIAADFHILQTATLVPWHHTDIEAPLALVQVAKHNQTYKDEYLSNEEKDVWADDCPQEVVHLRYTAAVFKDTFHYSDDRMAIGLKEFSEEYQPRLAQPLQALSLNTAVFNGCFSHLTAGIEI